MDGPQGTALALTFGLLADPCAKTAHGLMRGSERFELLGIVDPQYAGVNTGTALGPSVGDHPIFASVDEALGSVQRRPDFAIVGVAFPGGRLPEPCIQDLAQLLRNGVSIVAGLHQKLGEHPELVAAAAASGASVHDIRSGRSWNELRFWTGEIYDVEAPIVAVLGTDCALGKRTTARYLVRALSARGLRAEMIYTGQTGWMQGVAHGFIFDATLNDFVSGELEGAIVACDRERRPDVIILEGQSALRNPTGPCGAEFLLSANARAVVLQAAPGRVHYKGTEGRKCAIPAISDDVALIERYNAQVIAIALNGEALTGEQLEQQRDSIGAELEVPVGLPLVSIDPIADAVEAYITANRGRTQIGERGVAAGA